MIKVPDTATWRDRVVHAVAHIFDSLVDLAALAVIAYLGLTADPGVATELGGMAVAVAGAKRYFDREPEGHT